MFISTVRKTIAAAALCAIAAPSLANTELTMYYPVAVGGALTKIVDGIVADFESITTSR